MENTFLYRIHVIGRVQGVGFRWNAAHEARSLGITGFIKNLSDGSVLIEAEGTEEMLNRLLDWCRSDPGFSKVESVSFETSSSAGYNEFSIEH